MQKCVNNCNFCVWQKFLKLHYICIYKSQCQFYSIYKFRNSYSLPFDSDVVVTGRITTPFDVFAKSETFEALSVCSVLTEATVSLETLDDNVAEQLVNTLCPSAIDIFSALLSAAFDFPSSDSSVACPAATKFCVSTNACSDIDCCSAGLDVLSSVGLLT